jgi:hypothetical protein
MDTFQLQESVRTFVLRFNRTAHESAMRLGVRISSHKRA